MPSTPLLLGREAEMDVLADLVDRPPQRGGALLVRGDPGIGKTALLSWAQTRARQRGLEIVSIAGVHSETDLPFAGLQHLLRPVLNAIDRLPAVQAAAITGAVGLDEGTGADPFLIALGTLNLLSDVAAQRPMILVVDDAQWLDRPSAEALAFVARRVDADPIVVLATVRDGYASPLVEAHLPELVVEGLSEDDSRRLLQARSLPDAAHERVLRAADGNPLALLELAKSLRDGSADGGDVVAISERIERSFAARTRELPKATRVLILTAALDHGGALDEILAAAEAVDGIPRTVGDVDPAAQARLVEVDGLTLRFRHPLVRSAVAQAASAADRQAVHAALAAAVGDLDRRAWHLAAAAPGRDRSVALELERAGQRALRRGALATAVAAFERGAQLSPTARDRGRMLLLATAAATEQGHMTSVARLLAATAGLDLDLRDRARWMAVEDSIREGPIGDREWVRALAAMARRVGDAGDVDVALDLLVAAAARCYFADLVEDGRAIVAIADALDLRPDDQRRLYIRAFAAPLERGAAVLEAFAGMEPPEDPGGLYLRAMAVCLSGAFDEAAPLLATSSQRMREQGRLRRLVAVQSIRSWCTLMTGDFATSIPVAEECVRLAAETGQRMFVAQGQVAQATIAAFRGDRATVERLTAAVEPLSLAIGGASQLSLIQYARGVLELGEGRHADAWQQLRRITEPGDPAHHTLTACHAFGDLAEAATRSGHRDAGLELLTSIAAVADPIPGSWTQSALLYGRAQLADDDEAEALFQEGLARDLGAGPLLRARMHLTYGEWLRRHRRAVESRAALRTARDAFDALRLPSWAERARRELRAAGESSDRDGAARLEELTPQELHIVQLAARGLSNREIAQQLYLSRRTVESHLYRVFPKLGVSSRGQLRRVLGSEPSVSGNAR